VCVITICDRIVFGHVGMYAECLHQLHAKIVAMPILIQMRPGLSLSSSRNYVLLFDLYASYLVFSATASSSSSGKILAAADGIEVLS
jgi:hypothetical protein